MAMIVEAFVGNCVDKLVTLASEEVAMVLGVKDEVERLQELLTTIHKCLEAAERRRFQDKRIDDWVGKLKDVAYDADDIIDLCIIKGAHLLRNRPSPTIKTFVRFDFSGSFTWFASIPLRYKIGKRIKRLNGKLEEINRDRQQFHLEEGREDQESQTVVNTRQTSSLVELDLVGDEIEEATRELVNMMVEEHSDKCRVFAVTGMGGIGKTTLAKEIINNKMIETKFDLKLWICVSKSYNEIELLQQVIRGAEGNYGKAITKAELEPILQSTVSGKRLFLVLDDVWRADVWISLLKNPLLSGASIVRVLVTTRDENVARKMGVVHIRPVKHLSNETGWELLRRSILAEGRRSGIEDLADLGYEVVRKCSGLPLAVKAIAGVLNEKETNRKEWEKVLKNEAWSMSNLPEELRGALYLSYYDLPSYLKQCFLYCSLFLEDKTISSGDLLRLWVAEGFVKEQSYILMEDLAEEYYNELIRRNLLQPVSNSVPARCKMHDLLRSLAMLLSRDENFFGETTSAATSTSSRSKIRRLSIENQEDLSGVEDLIVEQNCLRTLLSFHGIKVLNDNQLAGLACLRVLLINGADIETIPNSLGNLIHLRYLNLDQTNIKVLPESIGSLANLQFLSLRDCCFLTALPKSITKLQNLRRLDLHNTKLNSFPKGISKLNKINDLSGFVVADSTEPADSYSSLEELNSLDQIRKLCISKMERAQKGGLSLQKLTHLVKLELLYMEQEKKEERARGEGGVEEEEEQQQQAGGEGEEGEEEEGEEEEEDIRRIEHVLEELRPQPGLEDLCISNFVSRDYPSWMKSPSFGKCLTQLIKLELLNNISCLQLPPAGELPKLSYLSISGAISVKRIGPEFLGKSRKPFPNLRIFYLNNMPELEDWEVFKRNAEHFCQLDKLCIHDCPKLKALPKGLEDCDIKALSIVNVDSLTTVENLFHLHENLSIIGNSCLERVSNLPSLRVLVISYCPNLNCVEKLHSLQRLELSDVSMDAIPKWLARLLHEREPTHNKDFLFQLHCKKTVLQRLLQGGPDWHIIEGIPRVIAYDNVEGDLGYYLRYTKDPFEYETNLTV